VADDPDGHPAAEQKYRYTWTMPVLISQHNPEVIYHSSQFVFRSTDAGRSWTTISPDLTRNDKSKQLDSGGPLTRISTRRILRRRFQPGGITETGWCPLGRNRRRPPPCHPRRRKELGERYTKEMPEWAMISLIDASSFDAATAFIAVDAHKLDNFVPTFSRRPTRQELD